MAKKEKRLAQTQERRKEILAHQMRNSYLDRLEKSEADLVAIDDEAMARKEDLERLTVEVEKKLAFED